MSLLDRIRSPEDLRRLDEKELGELAGELRAAICGTTAKNGGHFASNLGAVELTIALHRVFLTPSEKIVFDVGHQAYAHKLLTGRADRFSTLRQKGGLSGFTNREESPYDATTAGHSGSSLSAAIGFAEAEKTRGSGRWTAAVVGDGSFTNGMIYEALNQRSGSDLRLCIVLNDNTMSISENVGGLSRYLSYIRTSQGYFQFKLGFKRVFSRIPLIGPVFIAAGRRIRDFIKRTTGSETFFEKLGLEYIGPVRGDDIKRLTHVLEEAKTKDCPVIVHVVTKKGRGYPDAEEHPEKYHSVAPFDLTKGVGEVSASPFAERMGRELLAMAERDGRVTAITAAMKDGCGLADFAERYPNRFYDVGIAEEHAVAMAGGMALAGLKPAVVLYSTFAQRVFDQLWHDAALQRADLLLLLSHAGLVPGDGVTHQGIYDAALFARIPGIRIDSPDTYAELERVMRRAEESGGVTVVRVPKGGEAVYDFAWESHGDWKSVFFGAPAPSGDDGSDAAGRGYSCVVTYGRIAKNAAEAAKRAAESKPGARIEVILLERIVPLPFDGELRALLRGAEKVLFVEEGIRSGGVGESFAASADLRGKGVFIRAVENGFLPHASLDELMRLVGLDVDSLAEWMGTVLG